MKEVYEKLEEKNKSFETKFPESDGIVRKSYCRSCGKLRSGCLLDLSIHYYGASRQDVYRSLAAFGISDQDTADAIYDYIRTEPTTYLKYYLGYLEILALRDKATELWGDDYTPLRFHTFLLQAGPSDFTSLEKKLAETPTVKTTLSYMETEKKLARG